MIDKAAGPLRWRKSSHSMNGGECVEFAVPGTSTVAVRDSKDPQGPSLLFSSDAWTAFVTEVGQGRFDPA
ncbi:toxin [Wenjunlia vitaminophila]|uniref:Toxin n=1 Tax=Wenjunlia vitaminophila TaxID=76728 RepID=A0A0T6LV83_WENVI|nr:DUF397 domain-containing protein [Wenjunlia vitaminophila]KRV50029.1 toxin [Wenjunlia vitaminophila]